MLSDMDIKIIKKNNSGEFCYVSSEDLANFLESAASTNDLAWLVEGRIKAILTDENFWKGWPSERPDLDLSSVPLLAVLGCHENQLTELDLSSVPLLTKLFCLRFTFHARQPLQLKTGCLLVISAPGSCSEA